MSHPTPSPTAQRRDPVAIAALLVALVALVFSTMGEAPAKHSGAGHRGQARKLGVRLAKLRLACPIPNAIDLGTWCLESSPHPIPPKDQGRNDYLYAAKACVRDGGWLPSAAQLLGAAPRAKLQSTI